MEAIETIESVMPINRTEPSPKSAWYGNYVRRFSISNESGKGMNVMDLYPYSSPGRFCINRSQSYPGSNYDKSNPLGME